MKRAVVIRSGGLGDFVLALPFLRALRPFYEEVVLATKREYWDMIQEDTLAGRFIDMNGASFSTLFGAPAGDLFPLFRDSHVYSFLPDREGALKQAVMACGAAKYVQLASRPCNPPHVAHQMFHDAGVPFDDRILAMPSLGSSAGKGRKLWIHPGSGSKGKNAPLSFFADRAATWRRERKEGIVISLGEADRELHEPCRVLFGGWDVEWLIEPSLRELREKLAEHAALFVGNDSGVTHLAAALGIEVEVFFLSTDPAVWAPVGPRVNIITLSSSL